MIYNPAPASAGGVSDGDKGDIVVSGAGTVWVVDAGVITYAKIQNISATDKVLGRSTAGAGSVEEIACTAAGRTLIAGATAAAQRTTLGVGTGDSPVFAGLTDSGLTSGRILLAGTAGIIRDDANLTWDGTILYVVSTVDFGPQQVIRAINATTAGYYNLQRARAGTTAVLSGDVIGSFVWQGYQNGGFQSAASIYAVVSSAPSGSVVPAYLVFNVTSAAALDTVPLLVHPAGVAVGNFTPSGALHLKAGVATAGFAPLKFTAGVVLTAVEAGALEYANSETGLTFTAVATRRAFVFDTVTQALTNKDLSGAGNTFPTFNQNTTGSAAKLTTARTIGGVSFDGTANITVATATGGFTISGGTTTFATGTNAIAPATYVAGVNLTSAVAGGCEFDGVQYYQTIDTTSGRAAIPAEQYVHLTSAGGAITTIANFFGATSNISLVANAYYEIEIYCWFLKDANASVVTWTFTNSAAPTGQDIITEFSPIAGIVTGTPTATSLNGQIYNDTTAAKTIATGSLAANVSHMAHFKLMIKNGSGTSLKIQATVTTGNITPSIGSWWRCRRLSPNNIGTFAA